MAPSPRLSTHVLVCVVFAPWLLDTAAAQCNTEVVATAAIAGVDGDIGVMTWWDPDGAGPAPQLLVLGGRFHYAGDIAAGSICGYEPVSGQWVQFGSGIELTTAAARVRDFALDAAGRLLVAGDFTTAGGLPTGGLARWDGVAWSAIDPQGAPSLSQVIIDGNGDIVVGGMVAGVARWSGGSWQLLGGGMDNGADALFLDANGDIFAGGNFNTAGGVAARGLARWDGQAWHAVGGGVSGAARLIQRAANGDLLIAGAFTHVGSGQLANSVARFDGTNWQTFASGVSNPVWAMAELPNGDLCVGGQFPSAGGVTVNRLARWDGVAWQAFGDGVDGEVHAMTMSASGELVIGGDFRVVAGHGMRSLGVLRPAGFEPFADPLSGPSDAITLVVELPSGELVIGGGFFDIGGAATRYLARGDGVTMLPVMAPLSGPPTAMVAAPDGSVLVAGPFDASLGAPQQFVARWDPVADTWAALAAGPGGEVHDVVALPNGEVVAAGSFADGLARWDGVAWTGMPYTTTGAAWQGQLLAVDDGGTLVAHATDPLAFPLPNGAVLQWIGSGWSPLLQVADCRRLRWLSDGTLLLLRGGNSDYWRWNGASWSQRSLPFSRVATDGVLLPNGDLLLAMYSTLPITPLTPNVPQLVRTTPAGVANDIAIGNQGRVTRLHPLQNGDVWALGEFTAMSGEVASHAVRLTTTCPATVTSAGVGCTGVTAAPLVEATLPWLGGTWRATGTGMALDMPVVVVYGAQPFGLPLNAVLPSPAGCVLYATMDFLQLEMAVGDTCEVAFVLPNVPALAGADFLHQMVPIALDAQGGIAEVTASNALRVTAGFF